MMRFAYVFLIFSLMACGDAANSQSNYDGKKNELDNNISAEYWNEGKAEIATYELVQNRYNALHPGKIVSIFVTEDFLTDKQVKNESYTSSKYTKIIKNIRLRKFTTGIYDYSMHTSVFTPLNRNKFNTLKVTNSMQEWCGTTFRQLNNRNNHYTLQVRSYFESEGDDELKLGEAILEDELFNLIRMDVKLLPIGEFKLIPSLNFLSLKHVEPEIVVAKAMLNEYTDTLFVGKKLMEYSYTIESQKRKLTVVFENIMPYRIAGFTESYPSAFDGKQRTTVARLISVERLPYWQLNSPEDASMRQKLGLE